MNRLHIDTDGHTSESEFYGVNIENIPVKTFHIVFCQCYILDSRLRNVGSIRPLKSWLGIPIFGSNFWDPHWKWNSDSVFDSEDTGRICFWIRLLKNWETGIPIPKFGIPKK